MNFSKSNIRIILIFQKMCERSLNFGAYGMLILGTELYMKVRKYILIQNYNVICIYSNSIYFTDDEYGYYILSYVETFP